MFIFPDRGKHRESAKNIKNMFLLRKFTATSGKFLSFKNVLGWWRDLVTILKEIFSWENPMLHCICDCSLEGLLVVHLCGLHLMCQVFYVLGVKKR